MWHKNSRRLANFNGNISWLSDMSNTQYKAIARRFVEEIFNTRKIEAAKNFVTPDIIYHGITEEVRGLDYFKKWVGEDLSAFSGM